MHVLDGLFSELDFADWEKRAAEHDFISTRVNELTDLADDPQILANGYFERRPIPCSGMGLRGHAARLRADSGQHPQLRSAARREQR